MSWMWLRPVSFMSGRIARFGDTALPASMPRPGRSGKPAGNRRPALKLDGNVGNIHFRLADYPKALEFQEQSLKLQEELGDRAAIATTLGNLGGIHYRLGDYSKALDFEDRSLRLFEEAPPIEDGQLVVPTRPGLGLTFDAAAIARYQVG